MKKKLLSILLVSAFFISSRVLQAQPGSLDASFGTGGFVLTGIGTKNNAIGYDVAVQPDSKIVVSGKADISTGLTDAILVRYNVNGTLDSSFGTNGIVQESFTNYFDNFSAVSLQPDGKLVVSGLSLTPDSSYVLFARYNANGTLDSAFRNKTNAIKYYGFGNVAIGTIVQPNKKILLMINNNQDITYNSQTQIERFNANGTIDNSFAINGNFTYTGQWFSKFAQDSKGRIVCVSGDYARTDLLRLNPDGTIDNTFGTGGFARAQFSPYDGPNNILIQPDDKILVCGSYQAPNFYDALFTVCRFRKNGTVDSSFNGTGVNSHKITGQDFAYDMIMQPTGKIVAVGYTSAGASAYMALIRYNPKNGRIDSSWGVNGLDTVNTSWDGKKYSYAVAAAITPDAQKIVVAGQQGGKNFLRNEFVTARFLLKNSVEAASGEEHISSVKTQGALIYPNPTRGEATISFSLLQSTDVHARLINSAGQTLINIYNGTLNKGSQTLHVHLSNLPQGMYYVILTKGNSSETFSLLKQ